jgi:hypothetical protein
MLQVLLTLLLLFSVAGIATGEISYVIEPFETETILDECKTESYNDQGYIDVSLTEPGQGLFGERALKIDYQVVQTENWGGFCGLAWILNSTNMAHNCMGATHMSLFYKNLQAQTLPGRVHLRLILMDDSDCVEDCTNAQNLETYYSFHYVLDNEPTSDSSSARAGWQELQVDLLGDSIPESPFWRTGWSGQVGNDKLDANRIKGWRIEFSIDSQGDMDSSSTGSLLVDQLACFGGGELLGAAFQLSETDSHAVAAVEEDITVASWSENYFDSSLSRNLTQAVLVTDGMLHVNYTIEQTTMNTSSSAGGGLIEYEHLAPVSAYYNLSHVSHVTLAYKVFQAASIPGRAHLGVTLLLRQDDEPESSSSIYHRKFSTILDANSTETKMGKLQLPVDNNNDEQSSSSPIVLLKGFRLEIGVDAQGLVGSSVSGLVSLGNLAAVPFPKDEAPTTDSGAACSIEPGLLLDETSNVFRRVEFLGSKCCEACDSDPSCLYALSSQEHCFMASFLAPDSVGLLTTEFLLTKYSAFVTTDTSKRGAFCEVCECFEASRTIDCRGKDLAIVPKTFIESWTPQVLDLTNNTRLVLVDSTALEAISMTLRELRLPHGLRHVSLDAVQNLAALAIVHFDDNADESSENRISLNNVITKPSDFFVDVCCGRGHHIHLVSPFVEGLTFCDMKVDVPGADAVYEPFLQYFEADEIAKLRPSSSFLSEAAESPEKCAEVCAISEGCLFFSYDARRKESEHSCSLLADNGTRSDLICCDPDDYADDNQTIPGRTSGLPPRTRHRLDNARLFSDPNDLIVDQGNGYTAEFVVSLGSTPLRGAVWIEPMLASTTQLDISISPQRVALYDGHETATIIVVVSNVGAISTGETLVITNEIRSCDAAFTAGDIKSAAEDAVYIHVAVDPSSSSVLRYAILVPLILGVLVLSVYLFERKRRQIDSVWTIKTSELHFADTPEIIGRGTFGCVLLAEYHGTQVAVKRVVPPKQHSSHFTVESPFEHFGRTESSRLVREDLLEEGTDVECGMTSDSTAGINPGMMSGTQNRGVRPTKSFGSKKNRWLFGDEYSRLKKDFIEEMRILSKLRHPCTCTVIGAVMGPKEEPLMVMGKFLCLFLV